MKLFIILLMPAVAFANMGVSITGTDPHIKVAVTGSDSKLTSDADLNGFQITTDKLFKGVEKFFGRKPNDVYVRSPTPWGDLYKKYNYQQVSRTFKPVSGKVLSIEVQSETLKTADSTNTGNGKFNFKVDMSKQVVMNFTSAWSENSLVGAEETHFGFDFTSSKIGPKTSFAFNSLFGKNEVRSQTATIGDASVEFELNPGQSIHVELQADKAVVGLSVGYEATLGGQVAVNYAKTYKDHHFWGLDVNSVVSAAGINTKRSIIQTVFLTYYVNPKVVVKDGKGHLLKTKNI